MLVSGSATLDAAPDAVWKALNDPAVLVRTIPGCERLEQTGPDAYRMAVTAGVAAIKGTYTGDVLLTDLDAPHSFLLKASGSGAPGTVSTEVRVSLAESNGATLLTYDAAYANGLKIDWAAETLPTPAFTGTRVLNDVALDQLIPYIDWTFFFAAWELKGRFPAILDHPTYGSAARDLFGAAQRLLDEIVRGRLLTARGVYGFWPPRCHLPIMPV